MAAAETARLIASLELQDKNFTRGIRNVERGVGRVDKKLGAFSGFVNRNVGRALDSIALRATQAIGSGLEDLATLEDATTSVTGAITQVGKGWEVTGEQIATWANEIEADTEAAFDDKAIVASAATLIRYGKVSEDNLRPALEVMTDLAAKTGDTESAATLLGKALADPAKAAGKLARQGIILTKAQQKQIKAMVKAGDVAGAQTLLLDILSKTTEGAAKASAGPYRDALNKLGDAGEDLRKSFAVGLLPVIEEVSDLLTTELAKPETLNTLKSIGSALADTLRSLISSARQLPWGAIGESLKIAGAGAKAVLDAFLGLPPWIQTAVITGWGLNKLAGGKLFDVGKIAFDFLKGRGSTPANPLFVTDVTKGLGGGAPVPGAAGGGLKGTLVNLGKGIAGLGLAVGAGLTIAAIAPIALFGLTKAIIDATGKPIPVRDLEGRQATAERRGLNPAKVPVVRPSNLQESWYRNHANLIGETRNQLSAEKQTRMALERNLERVEQGKPVTRAVLEARRVAKMDANRNKAAIDDLRQDNAAKQAANKNAIERAKSKAAADAARQASINSAQTAAIRSGDAAITSRVSTVSPPVVGAMANAASRIVAAVFAARPIIQPTNVIEKYTTIVRGGTPSDSRRSGPLF